MATNIQVNLLTSSNKYEILYPQTKASQVISGTFGTLGTTSDSEYVFKAPVRFQSSTGSYISEKVSFGDSAECYIQEAEDGKLTIHSTGGLYITTDNGSLYLNGNEVKLKEKGEALKYYSISYISTGASEVDGVLSFPSTGIISIPKEIYNLIKNVIYIGVYKTGTGSGKLSTASVTVQMPQQVLNTTDYLGNVSWPLASNVDAQGIDYNFIISGFTNNTSPINGLTVQRTEIFNNKTLTVRLRLKGGTSTDNYFTLSCQNVGFVTNATSEDLKNYFDTFWYANGITYNCFAIGY